MSRPGLGDHVLGAKERIRFHNGCDFRAFSLFGFYDCADYVGNNAMIKDGELLRRYARENDNAAFAELVQRHVGLVYAAALRRVGGDAHGAADVTQQVFTALARRALSLARGVVLPAWLYATTRNIAVDYVRAERRRHAHETEAQLMDQLAANPAGAANGWEQIRSMLDAVMDELGEHDREAVLLRYFARRPFSDIGHTLGLSEDAARMRVERALEKLRAKLGRRGVKSTAAALSLALANQALASAPAGIAASITGPALAAVATSAAGPLATCFSIMSTSKIFLSGTVLAIAIILGTAVHEVRAGRLAEQALGRAESERTAARMRLREIESKIAGLQPETARLMAEADALRAKSPANAARTSQVPALTDTANGDAFMARHPEVKRLAIEAERARIAGMYAPLFNQLKLTPAEIERVKDLAICGLVPLFTGPAGQTFRYNMAGDRSQAEAELRDLLGEEGFQLYKNYSISAGAARGMVTQLAGDLYFTPTPLKAQQGEQLQRILVEGRAATDWSTRPEFDWPTIIARARDVLSPEQLAALNNLSAHDRFSQAERRARKRGEIK